MERRRILALSAALAVLLCLYLGLRGRASPGDILYELETGEQIEQIRMENANGKLTFHMDGQGQWNVSEKETYSADQTKMELLIYSLEHLRVLRELPQEDSLYGFDPYVARVEFETGKGKKHTFVLGGKTMSKTDHYIKDEKTGRVFVTDAASVSQLTGGMKAYRRKDLFTVQLDSLCSIEYRIGSENVTRVELDDTGKWQMRYPFTAQAREIPLSEFINEMKDWNLYGYAQGMEAEKAGLEGSGAFLTLKDTSGNEQVLEFGASDGTLVAVRNGIASDVVLLYAKEIHLDALEPEKLLLFAPFKNSMDTVNAIRIQVGDREILMTINHDTGLVSCEGRYLDLEAFTRFYVSFMGLSASGGEAEPVTPKGPVQAVIRAEMADQSVIKVEFSYRDNMTYYMTLGNETRYYMEKDRLSKMLERLKACFI